MFLADTLPNSGVNRGEKRVGVVPCVVDMGDVEFVHNGQKLPIDIATANHKRLFRLLHHVACFCYRVCHIGTLKNSVLPACNDYILPFGQGAFGQGEIGGGAHDDGGTKGNLLEMAQVVGQVAQQLALFAEGIVF